MCYKLFIFIYFNCSWRKQQKCRQYSENFAIFNKTITVLQLIEIPAKWHENPIYL